MYHKKTKPSFNFMAGIIIASSLVAVSSMFFGHKDEPCSIHDTVHRSECTPKPVKAQPRLIN